MNQRTGRDDADVADDSGYLLDNQQVEAGVRFDALATLFNPSTFRHIDAFGIADGWRCWEVGAGGPSVPSWLAARVGGWLLVEEAEIDEHLGNVAAGILDLTTSPMISAWGRKPA